MSPEQKARQQIDRQLEQCGWIVQSRPEMNIGAGLGVAALERVKADIKRFRAAVLNAAVES